MMNIDGIQEIQSRINEIQHRFGMVQMTGAPSFQNTLEQEMAIEKKSPDTAPANTPVEDTPLSAKKPEDPAVRAFAEAGDVGGPSTIENMIRQSAMKYGVDPRLADAVAQAESGGRQEAVSDAGAIGVMQLMPETAAGLGVNPYDAAQNIDGGTKYLKSLLDTFGGDVRKAVAAYNAGPEAVKRYGGVPPYQETKQYVDRVLDLYR